MRNYIFGHFRDVISKFQCNSRDDLRATALKNCDSHENRFSESLHFLEGVN